MRLTRFLATITALITEKLPEDVRMANTSKDLIMQLSMHFIQNLAAKANEICSQHDKKTIVAEHVFEAMSHNKQTYLLGPILGEKNFSKLSYNKQRDIALKKVSESESQHQRRFPQAQGNTQMNEDLANEQQRIFDQAREN